MRKRFLPMNFRGSQLPSRVPAHPLRGACTTALALALAMGILYCASYKSDAPAALAQALAAPTPPVAAVATRDPDAVSLLAFGDWGQNSDAERRVADGIAAYAAHFDAGLLLGDNFYMSLTGVDDRKWQSLLEDLYQPKSLRFFAVLGNHDYSTSAGPGPLLTGKGAFARTTNKQVELEYARLHPGGRWNLPAAFYRMDLPPKDPLVTVLMLDSNYMEPGLTDADWSRQMAWLGEQLESVRHSDGSPGRRWVICCAHHPLMTNGAAHGDDARLIRDWLPLFERHNVDFYLAGHNHCMEHLNVPGVNVGLLVNGGGGAQLYGEHRRHPGWFASHHGFTHLLFTPESADIKFLDETGRTLHHFTRPLGQ